MKTTKYILFALATLLTASCMSDDWDEPSTETGQSAYGNQHLRASNLQTIAQLKSLYSNEINNSSLKQVKEPMQIQGIVVGNDEGGNIYNSIYIQDATGAVAISISQSGLYGPFAVGQCVLVELEGLYVGGYGKQPQIGTSYTNPSTGSTSVGRMSRYEWQNHYKLIPAIEGLTADPIEVKNMSKLSIADDCGKLITLRGVVLSEADGEAVFAPTDGSVSLTANCANRNIQGFSNVVLRTSTYANFASKAMPTGKVNITGVATRYNDTWQLLMRTESDIETSDDPDAEPILPSGSGTETDPYNVTAIIAYTQSLAAGVQSEELYVKGIITSVTELDTTGTYGNATYYISDDEDATNGTFMVYRGYGLNNQKFNEAGATLIKEGDEVIVKGKVVNYMGNTPEFAQGNYIVSLNGGNNLYDSKPW